MTRCLAPTPLLLPAFVAVSLLAGCDTTERRAAPRASPPVADARTAPERAAPRDAPGDEARDATPGPAEPGRLAPTVHDGGASRSRASGADADAPAKTSRGATPTAEARQRCELGWTSFKSGDTAEAGSQIKAGLKILDRQRASLDTEGAKVLGACLYNLGRVHEEQGDARLAIGQYARSLAVRPNRSVEARLQKLARALGGAKCKVSTKAQRLESKVAPSWRALAEALLKVHDQDDAPPPPPDAFKARLLLCGIPGEGGACPEDRPAIAVIKTEYLKTYHLVAPRPDGTVLYVPNLAAWVGGRCPSEGEARLISGQDPIHVITTDSMNDWVFQDDNGNECTGTVDDGCLSGCLWSEHRVAHHYIDVATGKVKSVVATFDRGDRVKIPPLSAFQVERVGGKLYTYGCGPRQVLGSR